MIRIRTIALFTIALLLLPLSAVAQDLHKPHEGTVIDCPNGATLHFVHNQIPGAKPGTLTVEFENAGTVSVKTNKVLKRVQHYDIETSGSDTLLSASDNIEGGKLLLSHVECIEAPTTTTTTTTAPTTTTTAAPTTTTTESTTTTVPATTSSTAPPTTSTTAPPTTSTTAPPTTSTTDTPPPTLPMTGPGDMGGLLFSAAALVVLGTTALLANKAPEVAPAAIGHINSIRDKVQKPGRHTREGGFSANPASLFKKGRHIA